jgi:hypothetical protein
MNNNTGSNWDGAGIQATNDGVTGAGHLTFGGVEDSTFTERVRIQVDGNVGIGTNSPDSKLEIAGGGYNSSLKIKGSGSHTGIQFEDSSGNTDGYIYAIDGAVGFLDAGADWTIQSKNDDYIRFSTNGNTEHMRIKSDGKVGIGTDDPSCLLQLSTTSVQGNALLSIRRNGDAINFGHSNGAGYGSVIGCSVNNGFPHLGFMCEAGTNNNTFRTRGLAGNVIYSNTSGALNFAQITTASADNQAPTDRVTILSGGNVGIGTADPKAPLHLFSNGSANTQQTVLCLGSNTSNRPSLQFSENQNAGFDTGMSIEYRGDFGAGGANGLTINGLGADATTSGAAIATFLSGGSVGIGTTDPDSLLMVYKSGADSIIHVRGIASGADARVRINGYNSSELYLDRNGVGRFAFRRTTGTDDLSLLKLNDDYSDNSTIMFWDYSSGDVGIGQASASYKLDVNGTGRFNDYVWFKGGIRDDSGSAGSNGQVLTTNGSNAVTWATVSGGVSGSGTDHYIPRWNGTTALQDSSMIALDSGFVGIGTATPSTKFQVHSGDILITSGRQLITNNAYTNAPPAMLTVQGPSTGNPTLSSNQWGIMIGPQHNRATTANSYYPGIAFNMLLNHSNATTYNNAPNAWIGTRLHDTSGSERAFLVFSTKGGTGTTASDVPLERMCIDPVDGFVGIGTTNPQVLLDVYTSDSDTARFESTSTSRSTVSIRSGSTGDAQIRFQNGASSKWSIGNDGGDSDKFKIAVGSGAFAASEALIVDTSGNLSILGTLTEASSLALKENIEDFTPSLDIINKIRPVKYNKKKESKKEIGLIAEELAELFPELVDRDNQGNPSGVNYSRAVTVLLGGFKELYKEIEELKKRI